MRRGAAVVAAVTTVVVAAAPAHGYLGDLDPSFSEDGIVGLGRASSAVIAPGPDGGMFALTQSWSKDKGTTTTLRLYAADGSVTPDFAGDGSATPRLPGRGEVRDMVMDSRGRLVLLGDARNPFVVRLKGSGRIDRSFADEGIRRLSPSGSFSRDLALDSRDRAVVLTTKFSGDRTSADSFVTRLRPGGALDRDFGVDGVRRIDMQRYDAMAALDTDAQNRPVVGGVGQRSAALKLVRLTEGRGRLDTSFSDDGVARANFSPASFATVTVVRAGPGVTVGGAIYDGGFRAVAWRVDADGVSDPSFGGDGMVRLSAGDRQEHTATAVGDSGAVIATGHVSTSRTSSRPLVAALLTDGSPDLGLGPKGRAVLPVGSDLAEARLAVVVDQQVTLLVRSRTYRGDRRVTVYDMVRLAEPPG